MYEQVISLGFFCSVALELKRLNLRSGSGPFDWVISDLKGILRLMENNFEDFLNPKFLVQNKVYPYIYVNIRYLIEFYHDFNPNIPMEAQIEEIQNKYKKRIEKFYHDITTPTLFVRYIKNQEEYDFICKTHNDIISVLKKFNIHNDWILIGNDEIQLNSMPIYQVAKDTNDVVARKFLDKNNKLLELLNGPIIPQSVRHTNKIWSMKERKRHKLMEASYNE